MDLIYLDNCCFNRPYDDQFQDRIVIETEAKLMIQEKIKKGGLRLAWSFMLDLENRENTDPVKMDEIYRWATLSEVYFLGSEKTGSIATTLHTIGIKKKDSIHLACAIESGCDFFLTTDDGIIKKGKLVEEIRIMNPADYIIHIGEN
jgi:predicted nucleic acid-binding protein